MISSMLIKKIKQAKLIGRGCNSFATADKWEMVKKASGKIKYVICNCSESELGVFKDRYILKNWPEKVIDGIILAGRYIKASKGFIYLNPEYYTEFAEKLNKIITNKKLNIEIYQKPLHDYVGGEETAVINSMQGLRVEPKLKPPFPTTHGFENCPTIVNNCETLYSVSLINSGEYKNTRFYCCSEYSDIDGIGPEKANYKNQQIKELPIDMTVKKTLESFGYKISDKYFYQVGGGASGKCYNAKQLNRVFDGLASIIIYKKNIPEKNLILHWANFFENESCGQCTPCREGTFRVREMLEQKYLANKFDEKIFNELVLTLQESSLCSLGKVSTNAILSYWKNVLSTNKKQLTINNSNLKCEIK